MIAALKDISPTSNRHTNNVRSTYLPNDLNGKITSRDREDTQYLINGWVGFTHL